MIILLNGSINSGKSTVAKLLAEKLSNTAIVEIDAFHEMISWLPIDQAVPLNLENALSLIRNFHKKSLNVVVPYPLSQRNYEFLINGLEDLSSSIYTFTLAPTLEKALSNRGSRELNDWERKRIEHHYSIGIPNPSFGEIIDNSDIPPKKTADYIYSKLS